MFKENIKEKMVQACGKQSIDILIKSFNRQIDNNTQFSSIDTVHVLNAVLESPKSMNEIISVSILYPSFELTYDKF